MKKIILFVLIIPFMAMAFITSEVKSDVDKVHWYTWEEMLVENAKNPKPIFVDVYTNWCGWCKKMDRSTFSDAEVARSLTNDFYAVKLNAEQREDIVFQNTTFKYIKNGRSGYHELAASLLDDQLSFPTTVILDASYSRILLSPGYKDSDGLLNELSFAASGAYKHKSFSKYSRGK